MGFWGEWGLLLLVQFQVYVDESGDLGIEKVRSSTQGGASPFFVLGALVCQPTSLVHVDNTVEEFKAHIKKTKWKHATNLGHFEKVYFARLLSALV